ncbi:MAG: 7TM domain-containing protein [Candidatus Dojkabacteria bacterium]
MDNILIPVLALGIPSDFVYFMLIIPFVVMLATIARHMLGVKVLGMYTYVSMTFVIAFFLRKHSFLSVSISIGLLFFVYFFSYFIKSLTVKMRLHYFARISVVISLISILLLTLIIVLAQFPEVIDKLELSKASPFAVLIIVLLSEHFSSHQTQKGFRNSRRTFVFTIFLALITGLLLSWERFEYFAMDYPYIVFVFIFIIFIAGKYKGLRLNELIRFRSISTQK